MDRIRLDDKRRRVAALLGEAPAEVVARFARSFDVEYAHNSTAIEGNTLSLIQTKVILEDGLSVGGKALREIYEVANHDRAFSYVKRVVAEGRLLDEEMLKDIHALLMENIMVGGVYRSVEVRITGAGFRPSAPQEMFQQMRWFFADMPRQREKTERDRMGGLDARGICTHSSVPGRQRAHGAYADESAAADGGFSADLDREGRAAGVLRSAGSLRRRR